MNKTLHADPISQAWLSLRNASVQPLAWLALARDYARLGLFWQAGYAARQALRCDAALAAPLDALEIGPWRDAASGDGLLGRAELADAGALAKKFLTAVKDFPGDWLSWLYLARLRETMGAADSARQALLQAQALEAMPGESLHWLGVWRLHAGDAEGAVAALSGLLDIRPLRHGSMLFLGEALLRVGNVAAAEKAFSRASLSPNPDFLMLLAARTYAHNYWREAIAVLHKAVSLRQDSVPVWLQLAKIQSEVYELAGCRLSLARVQSLDPGNAEAALLEAGLQGRMGDARANLATLLAEYETRGDPLSRLASSVAMASLYQDELSPTEVAALHRRMCAPIEAAFVRKTDFPSEPESSPTSPRRLRIGYVTGDLHRQHPVNLFLLPALLRHDHARFDVHIYHTGTMFDAYTLQARACADRWVEAAMLDDAALQRLIVDDGVEVLVDLAGHTSSHRLGVFALRAAPVQTTFLGYPHSTGLSRIDWIVGDATVSPAAHAHLFSEGIAQLPGSVFCWAPLEAYPLPRPRPADAPVIFGSFNNAMKLSPKTIALWAWVLQAVPGSLLLLKAPSFRDQSVRARFAALFAEQGVAPERLLFRGPSGLAEMMREYGDVDIALDTTPYNGGTTTLQALWMGVPVVALKGGNFVSRMGASFLDTLGNPSWVARDAAGYVAIAATLAHQCMHLREGRGALRRRMASSPLCDIETYVRNLENLFERMWAAYREESQSRLLAADVRRP